MRFWLPRIALMRAGGGTAIGDADYDGFALTLEWLGSYVELTFGRIGR